MEDFLDEIKRPPSKNNLSIYSIIQILLMAYLTCDAIKEICDLFKVGGFSFVGLVKIVIDGLIIVGMGFAVYGFFSRADEGLKQGFTLFLWGCIGLLVIWVLDLLKDGFGAGSLFELLLLCYITYVIYVQIPQI